MVLYIFFGITNSPEKVDNFVQLSQASEVQPER